MASTDKMWWAAINAATSVGSKFISTTDEFNLACDHIVQLIKDASILLESQSHATAAFLAITAIEETSKVNVGMFRHSENPVQRRKDPLYRHDQKHLLALGPTVAMGERLQAAIGEDRMKEIIQLAHDGKLVRVREVALYVESVDGNLIAPKSAVDEQTAHALLLLAIEAFDDALVGNTNHTYACAAQIDEIFSKWANYIPAA